LPSGTSAGVIPIGLWRSVFPVGAVAIGLVAAYGLIAVAPIAMGCLAGGYYCAGDIVRPVSLHALKSDPQRFGFSSLGLSRGSCGSDNALRAVYLAPK